MSRPHGDPSAAPIASRAADYRDTEMIGATFGIERKQRLDDAPSVGHAGRDLGLSETDVQQLRQAGFWARDLGMVFRIVEASCRRTVPSESLPQP
jgi:hypothetical protein